MRAALVTVNAAAGVLAASYAGLLWRRRRLTPLAVSLALIMAGVAEWSLATAASIAAPTATLAFAFNYAVFPGVALVVAAFYLHARAFAGHPDLRPRHRALLLVHPLLLMVVVATDQWHHTFFPLMESTAGIGFVPHPGPAYWAHTAYSYALLGVGTAVVIRAMRRAVRGQRRIFVLFLLGSSVTVAGNLVTLFLGVDAQRIRLTPTLFLLSGILWWRFERSGMGKQRVPVTHAQVIAAISDAVMVLDRQGRFVEVNPVAARMLAAMDRSGGGAAVGRTWHEVVGVHLEVMFDGTGHGTYTAAGGDVYDVRVVRMRAAGGDWVGTVVVARDITELERLRAELTDQAVRDGLTGAYNRRHLTAVLDAQVTAASLGGAPLSVVMVDVDHFKAVNDRYGHAAGDRVLIQVARHLAGALRETDTLARYGGEEFVVVLPGVDGREAAERADRWRRQCAATAAGGVSVRFSAGVAELPAGGTPDDLLRLADEALYRAKAAGRNRVHTAPGGPARSAPGSAFQDGHHALAAGGADGDQAAAGALLGEQLGQVRHDPAAGRGERVAGRQG